MVFFVVISSLSAAIFGICIIYLILDFLTKSIQILDFGPVWYGFRIKDGILFVISILLLFMNFSITTPYK